MKSMSKRPSGAPTTAPIAALMWIGLAALLAVPAASAADAASASAAAAVSAADADRGGRLYEKAECGKCHGPSGQGDGPVGQTLEQLGKPPGDWSDPTSFKLDTDKDGHPGSDRDLANVITRGALVFGGSQMMGPTKGLTDDDVADLVAFIRSLSQ